MNPTRLFRHWGYFCLITAACLILSVWAATGSAQSPLGDLINPAAPEEEPAPEEEAAASGEPVETTDSNAIDQTLWLGDMTELDFSSWTDTATRAQQLLIRDQARPFMLERLRTELSEWRDNFASEMSANDERLVTVESQIAALGAPPADGQSEATAIAERRAELTSQRDLLAVPGLLASEAHAHASGLIRETELQIRERQTEDLLQSNPSPLNPANWAGAISGLWVSLRDEIAGEFTPGLLRAAATADTVPRVAISFAAIAFALFLFVRGRAMADELFVQRGEGVRRLIRDAIRNISEALLPLIGLIALTYGLSQLDVFGPLGEGILATVPLTGSIIILAGWLGRQFFPLGDNFGPLYLDLSVREPARRSAVLLAWLAALWIPYGALIEASRADQTAEAVLNFPIIVIISIVLFRVATLLRTAPSEDAGPNASQGRTRRVIGRVAQAVAVGAPLLSAFGYGAAAEKALFPTILTLGVFGVLVYLQALSYRTYEMVARDNENTRLALAPVVIGFVLLLISAPILALIWGAQRSDLIEYWVRFTEGFSFGETRISPSDFLWFVVIFSLGYLLTQFIKNSLRTSVLPRTGLDLGAQNAIVAGFGYIGIFLAAVIAITSAGIDLSNLAIVAGALSVGIGFGLQTIVSNFVSGIILLIERPISEGDWIEVGGKMGHVRDISVRSTRIETFDQTDVIVPNADLVSNQVINWTRGNLVGRLILKVGVAYGSDVEQVMGILKEVAENHPMVVMTPPPNILFTNFGADALEFEARVILRDIHFILVVQSEMNQELSRRFAEAGIEIPFAQRDIWLRNPEVLGHPDPNTSSGTNMPNPRQRDDRDDGADDPVRDAEFDADPDGEPT